MYYYKLRIGDYEEECDIVLYHTELFDKSAFCTHYAEAFEAIEKNRDSFYDLEDDDFDYRDFLENIAEHMRNKYGYGVIETTYDASCDDSSSSLYFSVW